jgi:hypothetical protein
VAQACDIEFEAKYPGAWMLHCHLPLHMMNAMSDLMGGRMMTTMNTNDPEVLSQMQTLADAVHSNTYTTLRSGTMPTMLPVFRRTPSWTWL